MTASPRQQGSWTPRRFWTFATVLFVLQAGLIWAFGERGHSVPRPDPPGMVTWMLPDPVTPGQLAQALFTEDPTLFVEPNPRNFSGRAWLDTPRLEYQKVPAPAPDASLSLSRSGWRISPPAPSGQYKAAPEWPAPAASELPPPAVYIEPDPPPAPSAMRLTGGLANLRLLSKTPVLPAQASLQWVSNSVAEIAVNNAGEVISSSLARESGCAAADTLALTVARQLRFAPSAAPVTWGRAVFSWQTVDPPPATTAPPK